MKKFKIIICLLIVLMILCSCSTELSGFNTPELAVDSVIKEYTDVDENYYKVFVVERVKFSEGEELFILYNEKYEDIKWVVVSKKDKNNMYKIEDVSAWVYIGQSSYDDVYTVEINYTVGNETIKSYIWKGNYTIEEMNYMGLLNDLPQDFNKNDIRIYDGGINIIFIKTFEYP